MIRWWPEFTPATPGCFPCSQAFPKLYALEQRYRSLFLGQVLGARARKRSGEVSKQNAKKLSFDDGLQVLIDALQSRLEGAIETSAPIRGLRRAEDGWFIELERGADGSPMECGAVLLALPSHKIASLEITTTPALEVSSLAEVYYPPVASVVLGFRRADVAHPLDGFGMLIPEKEGFDILGALFSSSLFPNRAPEGEVIITCYIGGARAPLLPLNTPEVLTEMAVKDLGTILGVRGRPTFQHVAVYRQAIPQYNLGFGKVRALMNDMELEGPGPVCGRTRPRRRFRGRFHCLRPQSGGENPGLFGLRTPRARSTPVRPPRFRMNTPRRASGESGFARFRVRRGCAGLSG